MSETIDPATAQAALPLTEAAPAAEPVAAPATAEVATSAPESAPPQAPAAEPAAETPPSHTDTPTLLQEATADAPKTEDKPADAPAVETKPADAPPVVAYEPFTLPEGVQPDKEAMTAYTETAGKYGLTQEAAQSLLDQHVGVMQRYVDNLRAEQHSVFAETRRGWRDSVLADEQIGGAGHQTVMQEIAQMRDKFVPADKRDAFNQFLAVTGAGDHPEFLRLLHNVSRAFKEPAMPTVQPRPAPSPAPRRGGLRTIYDSPAMQRAAGG